MTRPGERTVTLADGREVSNYSEEWRHECECRWLLDNKPTKSLKHLHLYGVDDRSRLFDFDSKTGQTVLAPDHAKRWTVQGKPLMHWRGLAGADRVLADAKRIYEARNTQ